MKTFKGLFKAFVLIAFFVGIFFFRGEMTILFSGMRGFFVSFFHAADYRTFADLKTENISLKQELEKLRAWEASDKSQFLEAQVYSRYPFSDKNIIVIDKGAVDGVTEGMPVLAKKNVLLGKVKSVRQFQSEVVTLFDPEWKSSVSIGEGHIKAVFHGANTPRAELIPKDATLKIGDEIKNIAPELPIGLSIGVINSTTTDEKKVWQTALVDTPFSMEDIDTVLVMTNFK